MTKVTSVQALPNFIIHVQFADGSEADISMANEFIGDVAKPIKSEEMFQKVQIDEGGGIYWPTGFDCCPKYLKELAAPQ